ncbi:MAG: hypothetical protein WC292_06205 [Clostridia bacterium]
MSKLVERAEEVADKVLSDLKKLLRGELKNRETDSESDEELLRKLRDLDASYSNNKGKIPAPDYSQTIPETLGLVPKEFVPVSDEELIEQAEGELLPGYQSKVDSQHLTSGYKLDKLGAEEESLKQNEVYDSQALDHELSELLRRQQSAVIRQGLVNSSINTVGQREIADYGEARKSKLNAYYDLKYGALAAEVEYTNATYQNALKEYDLKYAADLEKKMASLKLQQEKRLEEINKYNLNLAKQEEEYQKKRLAQIAEEEKKRKQIEEQLKKTRNLAESVYGISDATKAEYDKRYQEAINFYSGLNSDVAKQLVAQNAEVLAGLLGEENYLKLYSEINNK